MRLAPSFLRGLRRPRACLLGALVAGAGSGALVRADTPVLLDPANPDPGVTLYVETLTGDCKLLGNLGAKICQYYVSSASGALIGNYNYFHPVSLQYGATPGLTNADWMDMSDAYGVPTVIWDKDCPVEDPNAEGYINFDLLNFHAFHLGAIFGHVDENGQKAATPAPSQDLIFSYSYGYVVVANSLLTGGPGQATGYDTYPKPGRYGDSVSAYGEVVYYRGVMGVWANDAGGNWNAAGNWDLALPNQAGALAVLGDAITAPRCIALTSDVTLGQIRFDSAQAYSVGGPGMLHLAGTDSPVALTVVQGQQVIAATVQWENSGEIAVAAGASLSLAGAGGVVIHPGVWVTQSGAGALSVTNAVTIGDGGGLRLADSGPQVLRLGGLVTQGTGTLDIRQDSVVFTALAQDDVRNLLQSGALTTTAGGGGAGAAAALGYISGQDYLALRSANAMLGGQSVAATDVLVAKTVVGDANMDGRITSDDYLRMDAAFLLGITDAHWSNGDFNYDGKVDATDYALIDAAYQAQQGAAADALVALHEAWFAGTDYEAVYAGALAGSSYAVPEPGSLGLLILGGGGLLQRKRVSGRGRPGGLGA